jgi:hypothetical protein
MTTQLSRVDWAAAAAARGADPSVAAEILSLSSLYSSDFEAALSSIAKAARREPLNPVHRLRRSLLDARFGDYASALAGLDRLKEMLPDQPLLDYLRAVVALRSGRPELARSMAGALEATHPKFIHGKFLRTEAQIVLAAKASAAERYLISLPMGPQWDSLWADLLIKPARMTVHNVVDALLVKSCRRAHRSHRRMMP